jgi:hypothetical protein
VAIANLVYEYTLPGTGLWYHLYWQVRLVSVAGGGDYTINFRLNDGDIQTDDPMVPKTTYTAPAGAQNMWFQGEAIGNSGDVINVMAIGRAGDIAVTGSIRIVYDDAAPASIFAGITVLADWLRGLYRKSAMNAAAKTEVNTGGGTYDETTDSEEAQRDNVGTAGAGLTALVTAIWASASRTLTSFGTLITDTVAAIVTALTAYTSIAPVTNSSISQVRGDRWRFAITALGDISLRSKLWVTIKDDYDHTDLDAVVQIEETAGLIRLNKAAGVALNGDITVTDPVLGNIIVYLEPVESAKITADRMRVLDVQWLPIGTTDVLTARKASFTVEADVTRATS